MSKTNAHLAIAVPLFRHHHGESLGSLEGYQISLTGSKPIAYAVDIDDSIELMNAEFLEKNVEFLGDL